MTFEDRLIGNLNTTASAARTSPDAWARILKRADRPTPPTRHIHHLLVLGIAALVAGSFGVASVAGSRGPHDERVAAGHAPNPPQASSNQPVLPQQAAVVLGPASTVELDGVGPVRIGMTLDDVRRVAGITVQVGNRGSCRTLTPDTIPGLVFVSLQGDRLDYFEVSSPAPTTAAGVGVGSTIQAVEKAFSVEIHTRIGAANGVKTPSSTLLISRATDPATSDRAFAFYTTDNVVTRLSVGTRGSVTDAASCH